MGKDNHTILVVVGLVTLGVFAYLFHQAEIREIKNATRQIEQSNQELVCEINGDCKDHNSEDIFDF